jgi:hypothetical protein
MGRVSYRPTPTVDAAVNIALVPESLKCSQDGRKFDWQLYDQLTAS